MLFKAATYKMLIIISSPLHRLCRLSEVTVLHRCYAGVFASIVSVCSALENGRYGNAPYPIRVLLALVYQPLAILDQAGGLENAAYTQLVEHADH